MAFPGVCSTAAGAGVVLGLLADRSLMQHSSRTGISALILVGAAVIYPLADRTPTRMAGPGELGAVVATLGVAIGAATLKDRSARALVAAGWCLHALFDQRHSSSTSRLPSWYPALCAGFDVAMATQLRRPATSG